MRDGLARRARRLVGRILGHRRLGLHNGRIALAALLGFAAHLRQPLLQRNALAGGVAPPEKEQGAAHQNPSGQAGGNDDHIAQAAFGRSRRFGRRLGRRFCVCGFLRQDFGRGRRRIRRRRRWMRRWRRRRRRRRGDPAVRRQRLIGKRPEHRLHWLAAGIPGVNSDGHVVLAGIGRVGESGGELAGHDRKNHMLAGPARRSDKRRGDIHRAERFGRDIQPHIADKRLAGRSGRGLQRRLDPLAAGFEIPALKALQRAAQGHDFQLIAAVPGNGGQ
ncbi:MAG: hypothetical protein BWZ10_02196 [candidate division BRC1 bacterium ADurb.BinA364]|nr:MAG: hypothetical protein BWZ10_02196 [candidate division BRC1 bacterium ADurb.BinA364]